MDRRSTGGGATSRGRVSSLAIGYACPFGACRVGGARLEVTLRRVRACSDRSVGERRRIDPE
eukprot:5556834-Pleurochrysis_carterae.AAC.3